MARRKRDPVGVYVVSYRRAGMVTTDRIFARCRIVVPESQADEYAAHPLRNGAELFPCPDEADGNVARKRNWVLDHAPERNLVLLDDDYKWMGYVEGRAAHRMEPDHIEWWLDHVKVLLDDLDVHMFGVNQQVDPKFYREYSPFAILSPILGPFQWFRETPLRYDESLWLKEDYDMWLQHIHRFHRSLRWNKYHYQVDHLSRPGGVVGKRTLDEEERQLRRLRQKWGHHQVRWNLEKSINPRVTVPIRGI